MKQESMENIREIIFRSFVIKGIFGQSIPHLIRGNHYAAFPPKLVEICMLAGCPKGGVILDPFIGSGTVGFVALMQDRNYIGIELNEEYVNLARKRIKTEVKKLGKEKEDTVWK